MRGVMSLWRVIPAVMRLRRRVLFLAAMVLAQMAPIRAQQLPPVEPPQPMQVPQGESANLRVATTEVLVPTLVENAAAAFFTV